MGRHMNLPWRKPQPTFAPEPSNKFDLIWAAQIPEQPEVDEWKTTAYGFKIELHKYVFNYQWRLFCILGGIHIYANGEKRSLEEAQADAVLAAAKFHALGAENRY